MVRRTTEEYAGKRMPLIGLNSLLFAATKTVIVLL